MKILSKFYEKFLVNHASYTPWILAPLRISYRTLSEIREIFSPNFTSNSLRIPRITFSKFQWGFSLNSTKDSLWIPKDIFFQISELIYSKFWEDFFQSSTKCFSQNPMRNTPWILRQILLTFQEHLSPNSRRSSLKIHDKYF